jgi:hypothetical protein
MKFNELRIGGPGFTPFSLGEPMYVYDGELLLGTLDPVQVTHGGSNVHITRIVPTQLARTGKRTFDPLVLLETISFIAGRFPAVQTVSFSLRSEVASYEEGMKIASARSTLLQRIGTDRVTISPQSDSAAPGNFVVHGVWIYNERNLATLGQCLQRERAIYRDCEAAVGRETARQSLGGRFRRWLWGDDSLVN